MKEGVKSVPKKSTASVRTGNYCPAGATERQRLQHRADETGAEQSAKLIHLVTKVHQ